PNTVAENLHLRIDNSANSFLYFPVALQQTLNQHVRVTNSKSSFIAGPFNDTYPFRHGRSSYNFISDSFQSRVQSRQFSKIRGSVNSQITVHDSNWFTNVVTPNILTNLTFDQFPFVISDEEVKQDIIGENPDLLGLYVQNGIIDSNDCSIHKSGGASIFNSYHSSIGHEFANRGAVETTVESFTNKRNMIINSVDSVIDRIPVNKADTNAPVFDPNG